MGQGRGTAIPIPTSHGWERQHHASSSSCRGSPLPSRFFSCYQQNEDLTRRWKALQAQTIRGSCCLSLGRHSITTEEAGQLLNRQHSCSQITGWVSDHGMYPFMYIKRREHWYLGILSGEPESLPKWGFLGYKSQWSNLMDTEIPISKTT